MKNRTSLVSAVGALLALSLATSSVEAGRARSGPVAATAVAMSAAAAASIYVPDPSRTPGALNPDISQETFHQRICVEGAAQYRPLPSYTTALKKQQLRDFNYADRDPSAYEEDHLIPLSLGGHPRSPKNLWPQPWHGEWGARKKDRLEFALYKAACKGEITLAEARAAFAPDWTTSYRRYESLIKKYRYAHDDEAQALLP